MIKKNIVHLKNGCTVIFSIDNNRKQSYAKIYVKYGGAVKKVMINGETLEIPDGIAHAIEHTVLENSKHGNLVNYMRSRYVSINGATSNNSTYYYIKTVFNFNRYFKILMDAILNAKFSKEQLEKTMKPIIEERKRVQDRNYKKMHEAILKNVLTSNGHIDNLGSLETLTNMDYDLLRLCYETFYQPENIVIGISGKVDEKKILSIIEEQFEKYNKKAIDYKILDKKENLVIKNKNVLVIDNSNDEMIRIMFKSDISNLSPKEVVILSFYLGCFFKYNFSDSSENFKIVTDNDYSKFSFNNSYDVENNILITSVSSFTTYKDEIVNLILSSFNNINISEEFFSIWHNKQIVLSVVNNMSYEYVLNTYMDNYIEYGFNDSDTVEMINNLNYEECLKMLNNIDFSNYAIIEQIKEK